MQLSGKTALVTGGGSGIGSAVALALAETGCRTVIAGRNAVKLNEVSKSFRGEPAMAWHIADVADRASVAELVRWTQEELGSIDILVNCAGVNIIRRTMADMDPQDWDNVLTINATGTYNCMQAVLPAMRQRRDGLIVNISSVAGKRASMLGGVAYSASKFAVSALSGTVALEEGRNGIRVTNICPGEVNTPILDARPTPVTDEQRTRMLQPEDVAAAVLMIACLPPRAHVAEMIIKPTVQDYA